MSGLSYIGSKISLISKSDIRYVGILQDVDPKNATIALEQVMCLGTEGRRGNPAEEMPPAENVFKNILFRGSDVKDLQVFEAPPARTPATTLPVNNTGFGGYPPQPQGMPVARPQQPQLQTQPQPQQYPPPPPYFMMNYPYGFDPYRQQHAQSSMLGGFPPYYPPIPGDTSLQHPGPPPPVSASLPLEQPTERLAAPGSKSGPTSNAPSSPVLNAAAAEPTPKPDLKDAEGEATPVKSEVTATSLEELARSVSEMSVAKERHPPRENRPTQTGRQSNGNAATQPKSSSRNAKGGSKKAAPIQEFDFASANAKFDKSKLVKEVRTKLNGTDEEHVQEASDEVDIPPPPEEPYYNKAKSFFDNISCESKEREENNLSSIDRRAKYQEERKLNLETFGEVSVDRKQRNHRGRHGYRGRGQSRRDNGLRGDRVVKT